MLMYKDQGYTHISLTPGTNPGHGALPTALDQTRMFWKLAAAKGYLQAFQKSLAFSRCSSCTFRTLQQDGMAQGCSQSMSHTETTLEMVQSHCIGLGWNVQIFVT